MASSLGGNHRRPLPVASVPMQLGGPPAYRAGRRPVVLYSDIDSSAYEAHVAGSHHKGAGPQKLQLTAPLQVYVRDTLRKIVMPNGEPPPDRSIFQSSGASVADTRKPIHHACVPLPSHVETAVRQQTTPLAPTVQPSLTEAHEALASSVVGRPSPDGATRVDMEAAMALSAYDLTVACSPMAARGHRGGSPDTSPRRARSGVPDGFEGDDDGNYGLGQPHKLPRRVEELALPHKSRRVVRARMQPKDALSPAELPQTLRMIERGLVLQSKEAKAAQDQRASHEAREATVREAVAVQRAKVAPLVHARNKISMPDATSEDPCFNGAAPKTENPRDLTHVRLLSPPRARAATPSERPITLPPVSAAGLTFSKTAAQPMAPGANAAASLQNVTAFKAKSQRARLRKRLAGAGEHSDDDSSLGNTVSLATRTPLAAGLHGGSRRHSRAPAMHQSTRSSVTPQPLAISSHPSSHHATPAVHAQGIYTPHSHT